MSIRLKLLAGMLGALAGIGAAGALAPAPATAPASPQTRPAGWVDAMLALRQSTLDATGASDAPGFKPFISPLVRGDSPPQPVAVDVRGVRYLRLATTLEEGRGNCHIWGEARLIARDGTETRLCDLRPVSVRVGWGELLVNRNWQNHPLRVGDRQFKHGLWVHADSDVCYDIGGRYERFEAWVGLDKDRPTGAARFKVLAGTSDPAPEGFRRIAAQFPSQTAWLREDLGRGREADWFYDRTRRTTEAVVARAVGAVAGACPALAAELDQLKRTAADAGDRRWLDLYARACRARECQTRLARTATPELAAVLRQRLRHLADSRAPESDPRWAILLSAAERAAADVRPITISTLAPSLDALAAAFPGRFQQAQAKRQIEALQRRWQQLLAAAARDDDDLGALEALRADLRSVRRSLLELLAGMKDFLAANADLDLAAEWESQFEVLQRDLQQRAHFQRVGPEALRIEATILETDRDPADVVLRRTAALLADLMRTTAAATLASAGRDLADLRKACDAIAPASTDARFVLFAEACRLRRRIAFANPLLDFDKVLFIKRHRALFSHMCDQFYGMAQHPGGGLYILSGAFSLSGGRMLRDVLADSVVTNGRLKGKKLSGGPPRQWKISFDGMGNLNGESTEGGSFLSPDLSFDGTKIAFAYVECTGDTRHIHHTDPTRGHWPEGRCYHIFTVNVDGSDLRMLTDGTWNDFDPCFLPNGRIAFISERRGGYLRCGRVCPTFTLYDMAADGSDITGLSPHETNEWHPSVTNDGRIIYTRWDYVDRFGCTAHHPWITTLDGRDSRALHGNFAPRNARPDMELDCRAIPGSRKFVATAAPHHGQAFGSLVLIDPDVPDDDAMGPVRRITPEIGFPESQGGAQVYGTAWPLSEDYYLCVYDPDMHNARGTQGAHYVRGNYGIYLVDAFGNKELIYRDPEIACLSPIPLKPRPMPAPTPALARPARNAPGTGHPEQFVPGQKPAEAVLAVINTYDSTLPWPTGTRITALRILQLLPMSVPSGNPPHETGLRIAYATDSVVPVRYVLGTVPVEADGSAHFVVPANREIFFQALDENGLAVQSMRSATYLQQGERLVCAGCHEPKHRTPYAPAASTPIALRRQPSRPKPDVDGSNPFSYPRLVQPVLDRHCVDCHKQNSANPKAINLAREPIANKWFASYNNLVRNYAFTDYGQNLRSIPGRFGARASKLYQLLQNGHYDVKLPPEDMHRITLWLDCCSMFYGVYEKEGGEAQLRGEIARPTLE